MVRNIQSNTETHSSQNTYACSQNTHTSSQNTYVSNNCSNILNKMVRNIQSNTETHSSSSSSSSQNTYVGSQNIYVSNNCSNILMNKRNADKKKFSDYTLNKMPRRIINIENQNNQVRRPRRYIPKTLEQKQRILSNIREKNLKLLYLIKSQGNITQENFDSIAEKIRNRSKSPNYLYHKNLKIALNDVQSFRDLNPKDVLFKNTSRINNYITNQKKFLPRYENNIDILADRILQRKKAEIYLTVLKYNELLKILSNHHIGLFDFAFSYERRSETCVNEQ